MYYMEISAIALSGMNQAQTRLEGVAKRLARVSDSADTIDLSTEMVALLEARNAYATNAKVLKTADEMHGSLLDVLG